ncbi:MAG: glycosyltransferase family 2 protein [Minisyncoccia bacterium]
MKTISCIIPTYNEENRIEGVLKAVIRHPLINEIIVVDDGSADNTQNVVKKYQDVSLIIHPKNRGKSAAVSTGIKKSTGDFILLLDADLIGLTQANITSSVEPVLQGIADVTISLRKNTPGFWKKIGLDYISGERVLPRKILSDSLEKIESLPGFGLESFMNKKIISNKFRIKVVTWNNVISPYKATKYGMWTGIKGEIKMWTDIAKTIGFWGPFYQIIKMLRLKVK